MADDETVELGVWSLVLTLLTVPLPEGVDEAMGVGVLATELVVDEVVGVGVDVVDWDSHRPTRFII